MSDSNAVFEEVLQIGVDTEGFAAQMREVERIYAATIARMPELDKVSTVTVSESLKQLSQTITQIAEGTASVLTNLAEVTTENATKMSESMSAMSESVAKSLASVRDEVQSTKRAQEDGGSLGNFWGGLTDHIARSAGSLMKSLLIYKAFNEALSLSVAAIAAPFKAIKEGYDYLENVQERASIIQAALLQSVQFSKSWGDNVRIAGQEAEHLVKVVDNFAVKLHVNSQTIQTGLTTFLENGGANLVKSLDGAVGLSAIATGALQSQNPQIEARKMVSEIQKMVQGAATDSSKLAAALGLSKDQLNGMVEHAKKYHDLYQEILAYAPGIVERLGDANSRQKALVATLELYKERWEALIAGPLFQRFTKILQDILGWLDAHEGQMNAIGVQLGHLVDQSAQFAQNLIMQNWDGLIGTFKELVKLAVEFTAQIAMALADFNAVSALWNRDDARQKFQDQASKQQQQDAAAISNDSSLSLAEKARRYNDARNRYAQSVAKWDDEHSVASIGAQDQAQNAAIRQQADKLENGIDRLGQSPTNETDRMEALRESLHSSSYTEPGWTPTHGINTKAPKGGSDLHADMEAWRQDLKDVEADYDHLKDKVKDALASATINHKQAAEQIKGINQAELDSIDYLIAKYQEQAKKVKGAKAEQVKAAIQSLTDLRKQLANALGKQEDADQTAADREAKDVAHLSEEGKIKLLEDARKAATAKDNDAVKSGDLDKVSAFDNETDRMKAAYQEQDALLQAEVAKYADGTKEKQSALNALNLFEQQYTEETAARTRQRVQLLKNEEDAQYALSDKLKQLDIDRQKTVNEGRNTLSPDAGSNAAKERTLSLNQQLIALEIKLTDAQLKHAQAELAEALAKNKNTDETRKYREELEKLNNQRVQQGVAAIQAAGNGIINPAVRNQNEQREAQRQIDATAGNSDVQSGIRQAADQLKESLSNAADSLRDSLVGPEFKQDMDAAKAAWKDAADSMGKLNAATDVAAAGLSAIANIGNTIMGAINQYRQGQQQGGVLGGVGSLLASGPVSDALSMLPVVGQIVAPLGQAFEMIGQMFTAEAQRIAQSIENAVKKINQNYGDGAATLNQTITALQQQRQDAITELSGVKGGSSQLAKLLPELDQEIASLQNQVKQIKWNFDNSLFALSQGGQALTQWVTTWQQINQQVKQYLDAGGSLQEAQQYLNQELAQQQLQLQQQLNQGQQQAIQDALQLNQLQTQKIDLMKQEAATEFGMATKDAIEKRTSAAVSTAISLQQQRDQYSQQMQQLNAQLSLTQAKVDAEKKIFSIATDTATLEQQSNELTLKQLQYQLENYKQIQQILANTAGYTFTGTNFNDNNPYIPGMPTTGIGYGPPGDGGGGTVNGWGRIGSHEPIYGSSGGGSGSGGGLPPAVGQITVYITHDQADGAIDGQQFAGYLASEIRNQLRTGRSTF